MTEPMSKLTLLASVAMIGTAVIFALQSEYVWALGVMVYNNLYLAIDRLEREVESLRRKS